MALEDHLESSFTSAATLAEKERYLHRFWLLPGGCHMGQSKTRGMLASMQQQ